MVLPTVLRLRHSLPRKRANRVTTISDSAVGKVMSSAETARKATMAATTPVVFTASHQKINNTNHAASTQSVGKEVTAGGNLNIIATEGDIRSQGAKISAEGDALLHATNNIHLLASSNTETQNADTKRSGFSIDNRDNLAPIGVYNDKGQGNGSLSQSVGTELSVGGKTTLQADTGDINIVGSKVVSQDDLRMIAGKDINIQSAQSSQSESQKSKGWGSAQISDTERFDGYMANQNKTNSENITQERNHRIDRSIRRSNRSAGCSKYPCAICYRSLDNSLVMVKIRTQQRKWLHMPYYINGGDPTAGGRAAVASEAAANYLSNQYKDNPLYQDKNGEFQANLLPENVKAQIRDLTAGIGAVIGGAVGDSTYNAQLAGVIGQNAVENNGFSIIDENYGKVVKENTKEKFSCPTGYVCPIPEKSWG